MCVFLGLQPLACGGSRARGPIGATAASLHCGQSNARFKPCLWPTPQLMAIGGFLTHWTRPGIKPATSCFLVRFVSTAPQWNSSPYLFLREQFYQPHKISCTNPSFWFSTIFSMKNVIKFYFINLCFWHVLPSPSMYFRVILLFLFSFLIQIFSSFVFSVSCFWSQNVLSVSKYLRVFKITSLKPSKNIIINTLRMLKKVYSLFLGVPTAAQWITNPASSHEDVGLIPVLAQRAKDLVMPTAVV